jgi:CRP-like cAMP-binding protein
MLRDASPTEATRFAKGVMPDFWRLHGFDWLAGLPELESERLLSRSRSKEYARGEIIFGPASTPRSVYLLEKGLVRIFRVAEQGGEATLGYVSPGEVFGELEAVSDRARESFAQTIRPSVAWRVPIPELRRVIDASPHVALRVAEQMAKRFKRIESRVESLALRDLRSRLCLVLTELAEDFGREQAGEILIDLPLSQQDLSTLVGATRQSVNQCLRDLRAQRRIAYRNRRIALLDPAELRRGSDRQTGASG